jgi:cell division transport system permease protein
MQQESEVFNTVLSNWEDDESPLKDTYQVKVKDVTKIGKTADQIKQINNVSVVRYGEGMVEKLVSAFDSIQKVTYGIVIALIIVTIFLIVNTIKLTISARKREISIMRLVGASNFTIKTPFIVEGMILGALGSVVPILITLFGYTAFYTHFNGYLFSQLIQLIKPEPFIYSTSLIILIIGIIVGTVGSASAVKKYLKI